MINFPNTPSINDFHTDTNGKRWQYDIKGKWVPVNVFNPAIVLGSINGVFKAWIFKNSNYTATEGDRIGTDTSLGSFTITLPQSPTVGAEVTIADVKGTWFATNLIVDPVTKTINNLSETLVCDTNNSKFSLIYNGSTWIICS